jgi:hypothetical protein
VKFLSCPVVAGAEQAPPPSCGAGASGCGIGQRQLPERRMRPHGVVVDAPRLDDRLRLSDTEKRVLVKNPVATVPVEALDVRVLDRPVGADQAQRPAV